MKQIIGCLNKNIITIIVMISLIILAGCASSSNSSRTSTPTQTPSSTPTPSATATITQSPNPSPTVTPSPSITASPSPTSTLALPTVYILNPLYNVTIPPGDITVTVKITNFNIVDKIGQPNVPGEGHFIYYLDVNPPSNSGQHATTITGSFYETANTSYTWTNVSAGSHTISVQLVNNDGTPLIPPAFATEPVPVVSPTPSPSQSVTPSSTP